MAKAAVVREASAREDDEAAVEAGAAKTTRRP